MLDLHLRFPPALEPDFRPASLWNRAYQALVARDPGARPLALTLGRPDGTVSRHDTRVLREAHPAAVLNLRYVERLLKFLLWQKGGCHVLVAGADEIAAQLARIYSATGERAFDHAFMGETVYGRPFHLAAATFAALPAEHAAGLPLGRNLQGCRIGFDIGGSDRKVAALIDGEVVFSEEIAWDPYFQQDPAYHIEGVHASLLRAAAHLPRVDAIGGSAAGVYVNNEVRVASLFRGVPADQFARHIRRMFFTLRARWGGVPFEVANDGDVTALAGSMSLHDNAVLGVSMGTSMAGGYVRASGDITTWLNELAFAPVDYHPGAAGDEWSGDIGCGVQYFSQQAVARFARRAGFVFPETLPVPEQLVVVQQALAAGDPRALAVYETVGNCFGYAIGHYADFYEFRHLLLLGRVTSGEGGAVIIDRATAVLRAEFPALAGQLRLHLPDEQSKRHGQAIAAASLPAVPAHQPALHSHP
ncbi:MAG: transcriptional regulator [Lacunisphaera sp.]|nr:transcriptional regulator [Lacunisphaera sp.]